MTAAQMGTNADRADEQQCARSRADVVHRCAQRGLDGQGGTAPGRASGAVRPASAGGGVRSGLDRDRAAAPIVVGVRAERSRRSTAARAPPVGRVGAVATAVTAAGCEQRASASKKLEPIAIPGDLRRPWPAVVACWPWPRRTRRPGRWRPGRPGGAAACGAAPRASVDSQIGPSTTTRRAHGRRIRRPAGRGWSARRSGGGPRRARAG